MHKLVPLQPGPLESDDASMNEVDGQYDDGTFIGLVVSYAVTWCIQIRSRWIFPFSTLSVLLIGYTFIVWTPIWNANPVVDLGYARYEGTARPNGISQWLCMRYAAPPIGNLRFAEPLDPVPMKGLQPAHKVSQFGRLY